MKIEKDIIVDKHKGLFEAFQNIFEPYNAESKLKKEFLSFFHKGAELFNTLETNIKDVQEISTQRDTFMNGYLELSKTEHEYFSQKEKILKIFKEKISSVQKDLSDSLVEKQNLNMKIADLEKKYDSLLEEFKTLRKRMKSKISVIDKNEEKFCKNCQKSYFDNENFNWSCRVHSSTFNEGFYWCCGNTVKDSLGCLVSKHVNNESEEGIDIHFNEKVAMFCAACKSLGHSIINCTKDPNLRTNCDMNDELNRIVKLKKHHTRFFNVLQNDEVFSDEEGFQSEFSEIIQLKSEFIHDKLPTLGFYCKITDNPG